MNWTRVLLGGVAAGIAVNLADFVQHGLILGPSYKKYQVFSQTEANPVLFTAIAVCIALTMALLFARTRRSWAPGIAGGVSFGFFVGLVGFFPGFYNSLIFAGFPYHLSWCWGGVTMIDSLLAGAVLGAVIKD